MEPYSTLRQYFRDVAIALCLFLFAVLLSGALSHFATPDATFLYAFWFGVSMIPFVLFARRRHVLSHDMLDIIGFLVFALIAGLLLDSLPFAFVVRWGWVLVPIVVIGWCFVWPALRRLYPRRPLTV